MNNWQNFLQNLGEWRGSFTRLSADGEIQGSTPSILSLEGFEDNQLVRFRLRRYNNPDYQDPPIQDYSQDYRSLGRQAIFFDTGAFSKGPWQLAPFTEFGAEFGFVVGDRLACRGFRMCSPLIRICKNSDHDLGFKQDDKP